MNFFNILNLIAAKTNDRNIKGHAMQLSKRKKDILAILKELDRE